MTTTKIIICRIVCALLAFTFCLSLFNGWYLFAAGTWFFAGGFTFCMKYLYLYRFNANISFMGVLYTLFGLISLMLVAAFSSTHTSRIRESLHH